MLKLNSCLSSSEIMDISVFTLIRDASDAGGGISRVAIPVHAFLRDTLPTSRLIVGGEIVETSKNCESVGRNGKGLSLLNCSGSQQGSVVHIHGLWNVFELRAWAFSTRINAPLIISPHGMLEPWALKQKWLKKKIAWYAYQKRMLASASLLIVNSPQEYKSVRKLGIKVPIAIIENGVNAENFNVYNQLTRSKVVLFLSRLSPVKGLPDLLHAWSNLESTNGYELHIYGNADIGYKEKIQLLIDELNLKSSVKLFGPVYGDDKWRCLLDSSLFVLPSYSENFGIVIAEALYTSTPVITTRNTPWEIVEKNKMGWLVNNNVIELTSALRDALNTPVINLREMGGVGYEYVVKNLLWNNIADKYLKAYQWVVKPGLDVPDFIFN